jgi:hypothetical protein
MSMDSHCEMWYLMGKTPDPSTRALWQSYQQNHLRASRRNGRKKWEFYLACISFTLASDFFTCRNILRNGASGFISHPKEDVLRIFVALKNPSPRPGLNPWPLGPVTSTLTTTPPRRKVLKQLVPFIRICRSETLVSWKGMSVQTIMTHLRSINTLFCWGLLQINILRRVRNIEAWR